MEIVRFYVFVLRLAVALAVIGQLRSCTMQLMGLAAAQPNILKLSQNLSQVLDPNVR